MGGFIKPFAGIAGTLLATLLILSGPYLYWFDRTPTAAPLIHWHFWFIHLDFPDNPSAKYAALLIAVKAADAKAAQVQTRQAAVTTAVGAQQQATQARVQIVTRTIVQKVPQYVDVKGDAGCSVPAGFIQLHNAAASGDLTLVPDSPAGTVDSPSGVELHTVADAVASNYGICRANAAELSGWQDWYAQQRAASK